MPWPGHQSGLPVPHVHYTVIWWRRPTHAERWVRSNVWARAVLKDAAPPEGPFVVRIFGTPVACKDGIRDAWRRTASFVGNALQVRFGYQVKSEYYDLFSPDMERFPQVLALVANGQGRIPLVFIGDKLLSSGGTISIPDIRRRLEALGLQMRK